MVFNSAHTVPGRACDARGEAGSARDAGTSHMPTLTARIWIWAEDVLWVAAAILLLPALILLIGAPIALIVHLVRAVAQGG
ncbi:MAG: hypothetical protein Q8L86_13300 [Vicinamibacterales bacterium]|nr:hypothetical protein [Vicinamibacterales bacterium]